VREGELKANYLIIENLCSAPQADKPVNLVDKTFFRKVSDEIPK